MWYIQYCYVIHTLLTLLQKCTMGMFIDKQFPVNPFVGRLFWFRVGSCYHRYLWRARYIIIMFYIFGWNFRQTKQHKHKIEDILTTCVYCPIGAYSPFKLCLNYSQRQRGSKIIRIIRNRSHVVVGSWILHVINQCRSTWLTTTACW